LEKSHSKLSRALAVAKTMIHTATISAATATISSAATATAVASVTAAVASTTEAASDRKNSHLSDVKTAAPASTPSDSHVLVKKQSLQALLHRLSDLENRLNSIGQEVQVLMNATSVPLPLHPSEIFTSNATVVVNKLNGPLTT